MLLLFYSCNQCCSHLCDSNTPSTLCICLLNTSFKFFVRSCIVNCSLFFYLWVFLWGLILIYIVVSYNYPLGNLTIFLLSHLWSLSLFIPFMCRSSFRALHHQFYLFVFVFFYYFDSKILYSVLLCSFLQLWVLLFCIFTFHSSVAITVLLFLDLVIMSLIPFNIISYTISLGILWY